jgi:hypothetical protein
MMRTMLLLALMAFTGLAGAAPIPKALKKQKNLSFDGYWELQSENFNGKAQGAMSTGKYWMVEKDKFYYSLKSMEIGQGSASGTLKTPDEEKPWIKIYSTNTKCRLEIEGDQLTWVFANDQNDPLENVEPGPQRVIYYFKRADK